MRLGVDFGTTRTRVAACLSGNYPLITFAGEDGASRDWYPSLIAAQGERVVFGLHAEAIQYHPEWDLLRSFKRLLGASRPDAIWRVGGLERPALEWVTRFLSALRRDLLQRSSLEIGSRERLEVMVGSPAHTNSNQRFLTLEAFRRAGFDVIGMLNEPAAAGIEYAHRYRSADLSRRREHVAVYDLGGGTFDASVVRMTGNRHDVVASQGVAQLGGDDFDAALLALALDDPALRDQPPKAPESRLLTLCREAKEGLNPNSRKVVVDFGQLDPALAPVLVAVPQFYAACSPLIERTLEATGAALQEALGASEGDIDGLGVVYLVGGSCELPVLARALRDHFGKRVRRSPYPSSATAVGLAIAADRGSEYVLSDRFSRHFGVWREAEHGQRVAFDPVFGKETPLPAIGEPPLVVRRRYHPAHNIGRFRFLECTALGQEGEPTGDILAWEEVVFPFAAKLESSRLRETPVQRDPAVFNHTVEETYRCDSAGVVEVTIADLTSGASRTFRIRGTLPGRK
jgi:molecular chaperone DnaK (HSP70)